MKSATMLIITILAIIYGSVNGKYKYINNNPSKYVIVVGCDGMGQMYIENATYMLPNMANMMNNGFIHNRTRTRMPSVSAPNWATIITGMEPEKSGVYGNDWIPPYDDPANITVMEMPPASERGRPPIPIWDIIKQQKSSKTSAVFHSWDWIKYFVDSNVDYYLDGNANDTLVMNTVIDHINNNMTNYMFIHLGEVDEAGHASYWGSPLYYSKIKNIDRFLGKMLKTLQQKKYLNDTTILVTADHGGMGSSHGYFNQATMYVPTIFYGGKVIPGKYYYHYVTNIDFAPTLLYALGLQPGSYMAGHVMKEIFKA